MVVPPLGIHSHKPARLIPKLRIALHGQSLLNSSRLNKGTAYTPQERKSFGLNGRLPYRTNTLDQQCDRAYDQLNSCDSPIRKNTFLQSLKDQSWVLYYSLVSRHLKELVPVIYTPTQGDAIANFSHLYRKADGLFLSYPEEDSMEEAFLEYTNGRDVDLVVCTDAEAILGIGDQGVGGIGISTAKSTMYTLIGGLDPARTLSVMLDVGTSNKELLDDPLYIGWQHDRIRGEDYDRFMDKFVQLVRKHYPHSLLHFEDFGVTNAYRLLHKYKNAHAAFNDDIQGTGAVTLACIMAAIGVSSRSSHLATGNAQGKRLSDQRYVIFGAGSAGMGIAVQVRDAMIAADGISRDEANRRLWLIDREGLLYDDEPPSPSEATSTRHHQHSWDKAKEEFVRPFDDGWGELAGVEAKDGKVDLLDVVKGVRPTVLIGCSTAAGAFTEEVVKAMAAGLTDGEKPIIMPLSNPSRLVEAVPKDIMEWTEGRALVATGSPFGSVEIDIGGEKKSFKIAECNNALIYPGLGFGAILAQSRTMTDTMLIAGAKQLASLSPAILAVSSSNQPYAGEALLPDFGEAPKVNFQLGVAVAQQAVLEGVAQAEWAVRSGSGEDVASGEVRELVLDEVKDRAERKLWVPVYPEYEYDPEGLKD
ncbi:Aminoacid dehydrogenase-like protein [Coprinopsis marcescibilis]|uniref:Malic enzyme n=1 Tax=Coprinopsis marcescibilis TaxID=230819 RepID=A0A5C3KIH5_COPMA|nr:Aminoacid dehydrogenase-like protein [Coprinopsis marcescibilis]